jgi:RecB family exonuclease
MTVAGDAHPGLLVSGRFPELEDALFERVSELKHDRPLAPLTVVVGSGAARTRVGDLLVRRLGAVANLEVVTLARLARDLVARAEHAPPVVLSAVARERMVRRLVDRHFSRLAYFGPVATRPHFAAALAATFADLREALLSPDSAWAQAVAGVVAGAGRAGERAADLDGLYAAYCRELEDLGACDNAALLLRAAAAAGRHDRHVLIYGLYDLNPAQEALFAALLGSGADAFVPLPRGATPDLATAVGAGRAAGRSVTSLDTPAVATDAARLVAVWSEGERPVLAGDGTLEVVSVPDDRTEVREAVRAVVAAAEAGTPLWDCAVVVPHGADVDLAAAAFTDAGLPVACRRPDRSPGVTLLGRLSDCLAPSAGEPFSRRAVVDLLSVAPLRGATPSPGEMALWLDEAREAGIVAGSGQWAERTRARRRSLEHLVTILEVDQDAIRGDDEVDGERLDRTRLRLGAARALETAVRGLTDAAARLPERAGWPEWAVALTSLAARVFAAESAAAAGDVAGRLLSLAVLREQVDLRTAVDALRELLAGESTSEGRVGRDGVAVVTPLEVRGLSFSTVVFIGMAEGGFPVRARPDPILGDAARKSIAEMLGVRLPLAEERDAESRLLFGFACEAARDRLLLVAPRTDAATGRPRLPSRLLLRLASLAAGTPVGLEAFLSGGPLSPVWRHVGGAPSFADGVVWIDERERDAAALLSLSGSGRRAAARAYLGRVLASPDAAERRLSAWRASRSPSAGAWDGLLGDEARAALAARHPFSGELHPTSLERYVTCPFTFLLRGVLGLTAPEEPSDSLEMDAMEFGSLAHAILEDVYRLVIAEHLEADAALEAVTAAWRLRCAEAESAGVTGAALAWEVRRDVLLADLREAVRRDPVFTPGGGSPLGVEWRFGERRGNSVTLELDDGRIVRFSGRLDRVDHTSSGARVVDYKTGAGGTEKQRLDDGLSVQLPVYQLAVRQAWSDLAAGSPEPSEVSSLYRLVTRRGEFADLPLPVNEEAAQARLRTLVTDALGLVDAGLFPRTTRGRCDYCDVGYACGVSEWARGRKRECEALAPVVALQDPSTEEDSDG